MALLRRSSTRGATTVQVTYNKLPKLRAAFPEAVDSIVGKAAFDCEALIKSKIQMLGLIDTGFYVNSWTTERVMDGYWTVFSNVYYGPYLEYGTRNHPAYPHFTPSYEKAGQEMLRALQAIESYL